MHGVQVTSPQCFIPLVLQGSRHFVPLPQQSITCSSSMLNRLMHTDRIFYPCTLWFCLVSSFKTTSVWWFMNLVHQGSCRFVSLSQQSTQISASVINQLVQKNRTVYLYYFVVVWSKVTKSSYRIALIVARWKFWLAMSFKVKLSTMPVCIFGLRMLSFPASVGACFRVCHARACPHDNSYQAFKLESPYSDKDANTYGYDPYCLGGWLILIFKVKFTLIVHLFAIFSPLSFVGRGTHYQCFRYLVLPTDVGSRRFFGV